jgi:Gpi18-like mannosyltransferase
MFLMWRGFDFLIIFFSQKIIPYLGFFPYGDQLLNFDLPSWIYSLANFDGLHYLSIARNGYAQYEQAFFPLYPILIKFLTPFFSNNQLVTGLIISNVSFLLGLIILYKYLSLIFLKDKRSNILTVIFLLFFPTSFFFGAVYTEGLFFLLLITTLYFLKKENYLFVVLFAFFASLTRLVGVFLIVPMIIHLYRSSKTKSNIKNLILIAPLLGLGIYCFYLYQTTGDPLFFVTSQPIFGANRSSNLILLPQVYWRYFKIFITAAHDSRFYVSIVEFLIFNFVFIVLILDLFKNLGIINLKFNRNLRFKISNFNLLGLNLFSLANLILPTLTGTFSSIPRYSLFSLSFFIYIVQIKNNFVKYLILFTFLFLHVLLLGYFTQGYFIS